MLGQDMQVQRMQGQGVQMYSMQQDALPEVGDSHCAGLNMLDRRTNQVAIKVDDLECRMAAGDVCKLPDSLLLLLRDAHSPEVEL